MIIYRLLQSCCWWMILVVLISQFSTTLSLSSESSAQLTRSRLKEALSSPSGKLTLSPEIVIPESNNPTVILLQSSAIQQMSEQLRTKARANTAFVSCNSPSLIQYFCNEQETARGNFPGPIPVIYCEQPQNEEEDDKMDRVEMSEIVETGTSGILISVNDGTEIASVDDIKKEDNWIQKCITALDCGLQPIPEIVVEDTTATQWKENDIKNLVETISDSIGEDPVAILISIISSSNEETNDSDYTKEILQLPSIPKEISKKVSIMGSIRTPAGENRLGEETARYKAAGFTGTLLRQECVPSYNVNPSLEYISDFWTACIGDLKSTRSKTFNFRSKNNMEKSVPLEWAKYQKSVIESGALGAPEDNAPPGFNPDSGDYRGF